MLGSQSSIDDIRDDVDVPYRQHSSLRLRTACSSARSIFTPTLSKNAFRLSAPSDQAAAIPWLKVGLPSCVSASDSSVGNDKIAILSIIGFQGISLVFPTDVDPLDLTEERISEEETTKSVISFLSSFAPKRLNLDQPEYIARWVM